ncbi:hypothetical protein ACFE04_031006 [Oxalis oulophora]
MNSPNLWSADTVAAYLSGKSVNEIRRDRESNAWTITNGKRDTRTQTDNIEITNGQYVSGTGGAVWCLTALPISVWTCSVELESREASGVVVEIGDKLDTTKVETEDF